MLFCYNINNLLKKKKVIEFPTSPFELVRVLTGSISLFSLLATLLSLPASFPLASWGISVPTYPGIRRCEPTSKPGSAFAPSLQEAQLIYTAPNLLQLPEVEQLNRSICFLQVRSPQKSLNIISAWPPWGTAGTPMSLKLLTRQSPVFSTHQFLSHTDSHTHAYLRGLNLLSIWKKASYSYHFNSKANFLHAAHLSENSEIYKINFYIAGG